MLWHANYDAAVPRGARQGRKGDTYRMRLRAAQALRVFLLVADAARAARGVDLCCSGRAGQVPVCGPLTLQQRACPSSAHQVVGHHFRRRWTPPVAVVVSTVLLCCLNTVSRLPLAIRLLREFGESASSRNSQAQSFAATARLCRPQSSPGACDLRCCCTATGRDVGGSTLCKCIAVQAWD